MRNKLLRFFFILIWIFMVLSFVYVVLRLSYFEEGVKGYVENYGLTAIFFVALITDLVMQPIGPELPLIVGIVGGINIISLLFAVTMGSYIASMFGYYMGRIFGHDVFIKYYGEKKYIRWNRFFNNHGNVSVAIAALTPVPYVPICWLAGILKMKLSRFLIFGLMTRSLKFVSIVFIVLFIKGI